MSLDLTRNCGQCVHWNRQPSQSLDLSEIRGECRESPPVTTMIGRGQLFTTYPILPPNYPGCSRFERRPQDPGEMTLLSGKQGTS